MCPPSRQIQLMTKHPPPHPHEYIQPTRIGFPQNCMRQLKFTAREVWGGGGSLTTMEPDIDFHACGK